VLHDRLITNSQNHVMKVGDAWCSKCEVDAETTLHVLIVIGFVAQ